MIDAKPNGNRQIVLNFITPLVDPETKTLKIDWQDEIIAGCLVSHDGKVTHPALGGTPPPAEDPVPEPSAESA